VKNSAKSAPVFLERARLSILVVSQNTSLKTFLTW